jgi:hypothetical protein
VPIAVLGTGASFTISGWPQLGQSDASRSPGAV